MEKQKLRLKEMLKMEKFSIINLNSFIGKERKA